MPTLILGGREIQYTVLKGRSPKYTYLRFMPDLTLEIISPSRGRFSLDSLLREKQDWIRKKYEELARTQRIVGNESLMYQGRRLRLLFVESSDREDLQLDVEKGEIRYWATERSRIRELARRLFVRETSRYVVARLSTLAAELGVRFRSADVREIRNWGYCTRSGRISINWQLIALPERLREYVLLHELTHLSEFNHSRQFYRRLSSVCPDYRRRERELDEVETISPVSSSSDADASRHGLPFF
jgi:predicted metal-dependent hydrolase